MRNTILPIALTLILLTTAANAAPFLAADVAKTDCTKTVLTLDLQGLAPAPQSIGVRLTPTTDTTLPPVTTTAVRGGDGRYLTPALLLPLTEYRVEALDGVTRGVLAVDVLNTATIATMRARASLRTPVQVRRAPRLADSRRSPASLILRPTYDRGATRVHLILVDDAGVFLDQYLGKPIPSWQSRSLTAYNVYALGAQYFSDGQCRAIAFSSAD